MYYCDFGNTPISGETLTCTFQIDACFLPVLPVSPLPPGKLVASQVAVAAGFKKSGKDFYDVST